MGVERTSEKGPGEGEGHVMNIGHLVFFQQLALYTFIYIHILNWIKYNDITGSLKC